MYIYIHPRLIRCGVYDWYIRSMYMIFVYINMYASPSDCEEVSMIGCRVLQCAPECCSVLQCVAVWCGVLRCVAECCSVLQCAAVCCGYDRVAIIGTLDIYVYTHSVSLFLSLPISPSSSLPPFSLSSLSFSLPPSHMYIHRFTYHVRFPYGKKPC